MRPHRSVASAPGTRLVVAMAPELTIGLVRPRGAASTAWTESNGNPVASGPGWAEWHDPWPKPAYLFALVAGELEALGDRFTTLSGREVALNIWVRPGDLDRAGFAMEALKASATVIACS